MCIFQQTMSTRLTLQNDSMQLYNDQRNCEDPNGILFLSIVYMLVGHTSNVYYWFLFQIQALGHTRVNLHPYAQSVLFLPNKHPPTAPLYMWINITYLQGAHLHANWFLSCANGDSLLTTSDYFLVVSQCSISNCAGFLWYHSCPVWVTPQKPWLMS